MKSFIFASFAVALVVIAMIIAMNNADNFDAQRHTLTAVAPSVAKAMDGVDEITETAGEFWIAVFKFIALPLSLIILVVRWWLNRSAEKGRRENKASVARLDQRQLWNAEHDPHSHTVDGVRY